MDVEQNDEAEQYVAMALRGGPPLGLFEARLARARLAKVSGVYEEAARDLRRDAERAGYFVIATELGAQVA